MTISFENFSPHRTIYISPFYDLSFDVVSDTDPIDLSTLQVEFDVTGVGASDAIVNGVTQSGFGVTQTAITGGYKIHIVSTTQQSNKTVQITGSVNTSPSGTAGVLDRSFTTATYTGTIASTSESFILATNVESATTAYSGIIVSGRSGNILFQLNDKSEPVVTGRIPVPNSTQNAIDTNITLSLHDSGQDGVAITSVNIYLDGSRIVQDGAFVPPYYGTINSTTIDGFPGYTIVTVIPSNFDYESVHEVRVVASDAITDPSAVNTLDTTYSFQIISLEDAGGSSGDLLLPPTGLDLDACIIFDWLGADFGGPPDITTLSVTLRRELVRNCVTAIRNDIAVVNGVAAPGYTLYTESVTSGNKTGYRVTVCPEIPFNELETITVIVSGQDSQGNDTSTELSVSTKEETPPDIINISPSPGATEVASNTQITFDMHDSAGTGVDLDRLRVFMDDAEAVIDGVALSGYVLTTVHDTIITPFGLQFDGYHITVSRNIPFTPGRAIAVEIDGYDAYGNYASEVFDFTVAPDTIPPYYSIVPENGAPQRARGEVIYLSIRDVLGVVRSSININVLGIPAVVAGEGVWPFNADVSEIEVAAGVPDGYRFDISYKFGFDFNQKVDIWAEATDIFDNRSDFSSYFTTYRDLVNPTITEIAPRDEQQEVSIRPTIEFAIRDGYDVDLKRTNVSVNGDKAIIDGVTWYGYTSVIDRIDTGVQGIEPGDGYRIQLTPTYDFPYNSSVDVAILTFDHSNGNKAYTEVSWDIISPRVPTFTITPTSGLTDIGVDNNIWFTITGDGYGVNPNTIFVYIDDVPAVIENVIQSPDYTGTIVEADAYQEYNGVVNPRFLLEPNMVHTVKVTARENYSGNLGTAISTFVTGDRPADPKIVYIGDADGVESITVSDIDGSSSTSSVMDGYYVNDIKTKLLKYVRRLAVSTRDHGAILYSANYSMDTMFYARGDEILKSEVTTNHDGTLYLLNKTRERIDVFYNILYDDEGRSVPDAYYGLDGYALDGLDDGYFTDMVVTEGTSTVSDGSNSIFIGTATGVFRIETDESELTASETRGEVITYGVPGSYRDHEILEGTTNYVVALDANPRLNRLYVATRSGQADDLNAVTYINLETNTLDSSITEDRLIHRLINDISFQDPE